jgi:hypothetical protein
VYSEVFNAGMDRCSVCGGPRGGSKGLHVAVIAVVVLVVVYLLARSCRQRKEGFVSERAKQVFDTAGPLMEATKGKPSYSEYKMRVPGADPVQYDDLRSLWGKGKFTPENVQTSL